MRRCPGATFSAPHWFGALFVQLASFLRTRARCKNSRKSGMEIVVPVVLTAIAALLIWSAVRACRIQNRFLKWSGVGLAAMLAVMVSSVNALTITGMVKQHGRGAPVPDLKVEATPERIARGKAVADGFCSACHSETGTLTGGTDIGKHIPIPI